MAPCFLRTTLLFTLDVICALSRVAEQPSETPPWAPIYSLLLDSSDRGGLPAVASSAFHHTPGVLDLILSGNCLVAIVPSYEWKRIWGKPMYRGQPRLWRGVTFHPELLKAAIGKHKLGAGKLSSAYRSEKVKPVKWCDLPVHLLAGGNDINVTLSYPVRRRYAVAYAHVVAPAGPSALRADNANTMLGACTLFAQPQRLLIWAQYMLAIGVDVIYAYYNGLVARAEEDPAYRSLLRLVMAGRLVLHEWPASYSFYAPPDSYGVTQSGAMLSCIARYKHRHAWTIFIDDDEYPFVLGKGTLLGLLRSRRGMPALLLDSFWAIIDTSQHADNGTSARIPLSLGDLQGLRVYVSSRRDILRTKHVDANWSTGRFTVHFNDDCGRLKRVGHCSIDRCCIDQNEGGILHFASTTPLDGLPSRHVSANAKHWRSHKAQSFTVSKVLADMLRKGPGFNFSGT